MENNFKLNDEVVWTHKCESDLWESTYDISLQGKIAKIVDIDIIDLVAEEIHYLLEFKENIKSPHNTRKKGKDGYCLWSDSYNFKPLNSLKLKKFIEQEV